MNTVADRTYGSPWSVFMASPTALPLVAAGWAYVSEVGMSTGYTVTTTRRDLPSLLEVGTTNGSPHPDGHPRPYARSLRAVQDRSGLDWGQIAATLGVSRRSVHLWLNGGAVSGVNGQRIATLYRLVLQALTGHNGDREGRRQFLLTPAGGGETPLTTIARGIRSAHPRTSSVLSAYESLDSPRDLPDPSSGDLDEGVGVVRLSDGQPGY